MTCTEIYRENESIDKKKNESSISNNLQNFF